jgi:hypothetical protein
MAANPDGKMSRDEREGFLADVHVGVLAIDEPGRAPYALPVWYQYERGTVCIRIDDGSVKAKLLRAAGRATLTVQTEVAPYKYVSVEGPVTLDANDYDDLAMAVRYLGSELGKWYAESNAGVETVVTAQLEPEHWRTYDFAKLFE